MGKPAIPQFPCFAMLNPRGSMLVAQPAPIPGWEQRMWSEVKAPTKLHGQGTAGDAEGKMAQAAQENFN